MTQVFMPSELTAAIDLIRANGGTVAFPRQAVVAWGQEFKSVKEISYDPRCEVCYLTLSKRLHTGVPVEEAVLKAGDRSSKSVVCWGETFPSIKALSQDPRCRVRYSTVVNKLRRGCTPEESVVDGVRRAVAPVGVVA